MRTILYQTKKYNNNDGNYKSIEYRLGVLERKIDLILKTLSKL